MGWLGDEQFLNTKSAFWRGPEPEPSQITWSLVKLTQSLFPYFYYECKIKGWDTETLGYGVSNFELEAAQKSFGEAWERLCMLQLSKSSHFDITSSNGFAAGPDDFTAMTNSRNELIERAVLLEAWANKVGWQRVRNLSFHNRVIFACMRLKGWKIFLFNIHSNLGIVKACLGMHAAQGAVFDTSYSNDAGLSERKVIASIIGNIFSANGLSDFALPVNGGPTDHSKFYSVPKNLKAFEFLLRDDDDFAPAVLSNVEGITTKILVPAGVFPAIAVSLNNHWPELKWGLQAVCGTNPWPHPLA